MEWGVGMSLWRCVFYLKSSASSCFQLGWLWRKCSSSDSLYRQLNPHRWHLNGFVSCFTLMRPKRWYDTISLDVVIDGIGKMASGSISILANSCIGRSMMASDLSFGCIYLEFSMVSSWSISCWLESITIVSYAMLSERKRRDNRW